MTECSTLLSSVLAGEHGRWSCRPVSPLSTVAFVGTWGTGPLDRVRLGHDPRVASVAPGRAACAR